MQFDASSGVSVGAAAAKAGGEDAAEEGEAGDAAED